MEIKVTSFTKPAATSSLIIVGIYTDSSLTPTAKIIDDLTNNYLTQLLNQGLFVVRPGHTLPLLNAHPTFPTILLVGVDKRKPITGVTYRRLVTGALKAALVCNPKQISCCLADIDVIELTSIQVVKLLAEIAQDSYYRFDQFKTEKEPAPAIECINLSIIDATQLADYQNAANQGQAIARGMQLTKNLANMPSNICTPTYLAEQALILKNNHAATITLDVLEEAEMHALKMGALLGVSQGSAQDAKLICLHYRGADADSAPFVLVGKGITFDTGGNSLKSPDNMVGMKYDMCGAATVLGVIQTVAELHLKLNLVGVIAAAENMPGGSAYKPEDILTSMSGQTIEVISTDAEGRLVLSDALTYCARYKPAIVIDIATLTGAVIIALGTHATGIMANNNELAQDLIHAGEQSADRAWQLPLWPEYQEQINSPFADISNIGGRAAGAITAACFLSRFTKDYKWAHLDVAGTAAVMSGTSERLATGRPVPLLVQYLLNQVDETH